MRIMPDCISSNARIVRTIYPHPELMAGYDTGTPDIRWDDGTWNDFPGAVQVHIDQGGPGAPVYTANVIDVEPRAWSPADVPGWTAKCTAPRPTVYCDRDTLPAVLATGWRGDLWLAIPGSQPSAPPVVQGCNVVAVQYLYATDYDVSVVFDDSWPHKPVTEDEMLTGQLTGDVFVPFPQGSFKEMHLYRDFTDVTHPVSVRVAVRSPSKGYQVDTVVISSAVPVVRAFAHPDTDAVSLVLKTGTGPVGFTLA